jgi:hypothetical protein
MFSDMTHARWYGNTVRAVNNGNCPVDASPDAIGPVDGDLAWVLQGDVWWPYFQNASSALSYQARVTGWSAWALSCDLWDSTIPVAQYTNNSPTWSRIPITAVLTSSDGGWSGLTPTSQKYILDAPAASCLPFGTPYSSPTNYTINTDGDHTLYVCVTDGAGNTYTSAGWTYRVDQQPPTGTMSYSNGWRNFSNGHIITISVADQAWLSGIDNYTVEVAEATDSPGFAVWWPYNPVAGCSGMTSGNCTVNGLQNHHAYRYRVRIRDVATNETLVTGTDILKIDLTPPTLADVSNLNALNYLAGTQTYNVNVSNALGSPITVIQANSEDSTNELTNTFRSSASSLLSFAWVTENTDNTINLTSGWREYTFNLTRIQDEAGNFWTWVDPKIHTVYANPNVWLNNTSDISAFAPILVADGTQYTWQNWLQDGYGNDIVPAPGIGRTITQSLESVTNTMYLDQFNRFWQTSIYIFTGALIENPLVLSAAPVSQALWGVNSTNWRYPIHVKTYTPTFDGTSGVPISDPNAGFGFNTRFVIADSLIGPSQTVNTAGPDFRYSPLFTTNIEWDLNDGGFIEWTEQQSSIDIIKNSWVATAWNLLRVTFGWPLASKFSFYANNFSPVSSVIGGWLTSFTTNPSFPVTDHLLVSQLVQNAGELVSNLSDLFFSTHLSYSIDGKPIVLNSDIIGKAWGYFGAAPTTSAWNQVGIKIIGSVSSRNINAIVTDQFADGVWLFSSANRWVIRDEIRKNIAIATRNKSLSTGISHIIGNLTALPWAGWSNGLFIEQLPGKSILLIEKAWGNVELTAQNISWNRTLVVRWANLYIKRNMYYPSTGENMLGVVVQKDSNGVGWNLYIDKWVTNIVGTFILDGSVISYDGTNELGYNASIIDLKNQLHIFGTIVSENTIGWSRQNPPKCPSLIVSCPDNKVAQKYDLNYLRRYYLVGDPGDRNPFSWGTIIWSWTCTLGACGWFDTNLIRKFTSTTEDLAQYPTIIEYNSQIQTVIPIGFDSITQ